MRYFYYPPIAVYLIYFPKGSSPFNPVKTYKWGCSLLHRVIAMALPAAIMDSRLKKHIDDIGLIAAKLEDRVTLLEKENKLLKQEMDTNIREHVSALERRLQILEKKLGER